MSKSSQQSLGGPSQTSTLLATTASTSPRVADASIVPLIPYISAILTALGAVFTFSLSLFRPLLLFSPLPVLLYIFAPVTLFTDIATTLFIRLPYRSAAYFLEAIYPLYVLLGVACITGGIIGIGGRVLCQVLINSLALSQEKGTSDTSTKAIEETKSNPRGKGKRTERVKFEPS